MANMFSGKTNTQIPKTLSDCTKRDSTVTNLHSWAERLEKWGASLLLLLIIIGIVSTIIEGISIADIDEDLIFVTCLSSVIKWFIYAFVEYCVYHALALLISALTSITENTAITAKVALYEAAKNDENSTTPSAPKTTSASSLHNPNTVESKKCVSDSQPKDQTTPIATNASAAPSVSETPLAAISSDDGEIICPICEKKQAATRRVCWSCGQKFKTET